MFTALFMLSALNAAQHCHMQLGLFDKTIVAEILERYRNPGTDKVLFPRAQRQAHQRLRGKLEISTIHKNLM